MKAVVVYESLYGNTAAVAEAIAAGLRGSCDVTVVEVRDLTPEAVHAADLLVVGAPTHAHGLPSPATRRSAAQRDGAAQWNVAATDTAIRGVRELLGGLGHADGVVAAAFDTRLGGPRVLTGAASKGIAQRLRGAGYAVVLPPESFIVSGAKGPMRDGEVERARDWAAQLAHAAGAPPRRAAA